MHFRSALVLASLLVINTVHAGSAPTETTKQLLSGDWSTTSYYGFLRNPSTGALGRSLHDGKWFAFRADDSSYKYVNIVSGPLMSGIIIEQGTYEVNGNRLILHRNTESWLPADDDPSGRPAYKDRRNPEDWILGFNLRGQVLVIRGDNIKETFRRDPN